MKTLLVWMMTLSLLSLTGCAIFDGKKSAGNFCDAYTAVDMPSSEAGKIERVYRDRILANEKWEIERCR